LEAGKIDSATYDPKSGAITVTLDAATAATPRARVFVESGGRQLRLASGQNEAISERGGYTVPLRKAPLTLQLNPL
jgi:hypothetical protein